MVTDTNILQMTQNIYRIPLCMGTNDPNQVGNDRQVNWSNFIQVNRSIFVSSTSWYSYGNQMYVFWSTFFCVPNKDMIIPIFGVIGG